MHATGSNLRTFFVFILIILSTATCSKDSYDVIPDVCINFTINLGYDPQFFDLTSPTNSVIVTSSTNNWGVCAAGFDGNGVIVYNTGYDYDPYYAFDCTCPYCYKLSNQSVAVKIDLVNAICPQCGTTYVLPSSGTPTSAGPGRYPLKNYHTTLSGYLLHVWNKY